MKEIGRLGDDKNGLAAGKGGRLQVEGSHKRMW
jgi:hypothetical protein